MKKICALFFYLMTFILVGQGKNYVTVKKTFEVMGGNFDITVISVDEELGYIYIQEALAEVQRIEKLISSNF